MNSLETIINLQKLLGREVYESGTDYVIIKDFDRYKVLGSNGEVSDYYSSIVTVNKGIYVVSEFTQSTNRIHYGFMVKYHKPLQWFDTLKILESSQQIVCNYGMPRVNVSVYDYNGDKVYETDAYAGEFIYKSRIGLVIVKNCIDEFTEINIIDKNNQIKNIITFSSGYTEVKITLDRIVVFDIKKSEFSIHDMEGNLEDRFIGKYDEIEYAIYRIILKGKEYKLAEIL